MSNLTLKAIDGVKVALGFGDKEPRIQDLELAKLLEYADPVYVRKNAIDLNRVELESYGDLPWIIQKSQKQGRPAGSYYLNEPQALLVAMFSRTEKSADVRRLLITTFLKAKHDVQRFEYLESRILQFEERRQWERLWGPEVVSAICKLYRWPTVGSTGSMYAPLRKIFHDLYCVLLGEDVVEEIKKRNPDPRRGQNHHQLLQEKVREVVGSDVRLIEIFANQCGQPEEWWGQLRAHFQRAPLQLKLAGAR